MVLFTLYVALIPVMTVALYVPANMATQHTEELVLQILLPQQVSPLSSLAHPNMLV
jgi:hypothetical protein